MQTAKEAWNRDTHEKRPVIFEERYLAIRIKNGNNYNYGWIKLKHVQLEETLNLIPNEAIHVGKKN